MPTSPRADKFEQYWSASGQFGSTPKDVASLAWNAAQEDAQAEIYAKESRLKDEALAREAKLRELLALMYDKWENGIPCREASDDGVIDEGSSGIGNAFRLSFEEENAIVSELKDVPRAALAETGEEKNELLFEPDGIGWCSSCDKMHEVVRPKCTCGDWLIFAADDGGKECNERLESPWEPK